MRGWLWDRPILVRELRAKAREGRLFAAFGAYVALVPWFGDLLLFCLSALLLGVAFLVRRAKAV